MDSLNAKNLSIVFENLELDDLANCSQVCKKWKELIKPKKLFLCFGTKFLVKKKCSNDPLIPDQKNSIKPYDILNNSVSNIINTVFLKNIQTFIYYGKGYFVPSNSFNFYSFPELKYLEIMDSSFCLSITASYRKYLFEKKSDTKATWKYFSPTIETLALDYAEFSMLFVGFPNLKYIQVNELSNAFRTLVNFSNQLETNKWQSIILKKDISYESVFTEDDIFDFLMTKCNFLESIYAIIDSKDHLDRLLSNSKFKHICLKFYHDKHSVPIELYKPVIKKYEKKLKNDCNLCINNFSIRNLRDFNTLVKDVNLRKPIDEVFESCFEFDQQTKFLLINDLSGFKYFKNYPIIDNIKQMTVVDEHVDQKIDFTDFFKYFPNTVKSLYITSNNVISQETINLISIHFPYLDDLVLDISKSKEYNYDFIFNLKYIYKLWLKNFIINFEEFINSIKKLSFLKDINFYVEERSLAEVKDFFLDAFEKKNLPFIYSLILNRELIIFNNSSKLNNED